ncbi:MAG: putative bifunctional diguanylate cyclase/phosphodiesterase [Acidimicrobiales bacterium]
MDPDDLPTPDLDDFVSSLSRSLGCPVAVIWSTAGGASTGATGAGDVDVESVRSAVGSPAAPNEPRTVVDADGRDWQVVWGVHEPTCAAVAIAVGANVSGDALRAASAVTVPAVALALSCHETHRVHDRLEFILDHSVDIITLMRADGTITYATPSLREILGYPDGWFATRSVFDIVHPDDLGTLDLVDGRIDTPGLRRTGRFRVFRADGTVAWVDTWAVLDPDQELAVVSTRDVTADVEAQAEVGRHEERYRRLVDASPQGIAIHQDGAITYINPSGARMLGADSPADVVGLPVDLVRSELRPGMIAERERRLAAGLTFGPVETTLARVDGGTIDLEITSIPTTWNDQPAVQVLAVDITERRRAEQRLEHAALHDPLTALPNRHLLADRVDQAIRRARRRGALSAVLFCDLDKFKVINDALGHSVGDQLLVEAAHRLRASTRETDTVARFGGDEFVILTEDLADETDVGVLVGRIHEALGAPFEVVGRTMHVTASIGVALIDGTDDRDQVISHADAAMYAAKESGRHSWAVFDDDLRTRTSDRLRIEDELHRALSSDDGLTVHLQPQVDLRSRSTVGFEALVRWTDDDGVAIPPDRFLPIAADAGLLHRIGGTVITASLTALASLPPEWGTPWIAVNAAAEELEHPDFARQIDAALHQHGIDPRRLCIEITEHSIMRDPAGIDAALRPLRSQGVEVAIDDFGTGYSSLAYLTRFKPEYVKIDRSFTADLLTHPTQRAIVEAVLHLAVSLGIVAVAEGVETEEQALALTEMGCQLGQGWHFGRPVPVDRLGDHSPR